MSYIQLEGKTLLYLRSLTQLGILGCKRQKVNLLKQKRILLVHVIKLQKEQGQLAFGTFGTRASSTVMILSLHRSFLKYVTPLKQKEYDFLLLLARFLLATKLQTNGHFSGNAIKKYSQEATYSDIMACFNHSVQKDVALIWFMWPEGRACYQKKSWAVEAKNH